MLLGLNRNSNTRRPRSLTHLAYVTIHVEIFVHWNDPNGFFGSLKVEYNSQITQTSAMTSVRL